MTQIKQKYQRYKIVDWLTLIIGLAICAIQVWRYTHNQLGETLVESIVLCVWVLLMIAPKSLNDIIRKKGNL
jgi:hypothetical protein